MKRSYPDRNTQIFIEVANGATTTQLAKIYGVTPNRINQIVHKCIRIATRDQYIRTIFAFTNNRFVLLRKHKAPVIEAYKRMVAQK